MTQDQPSDDSLGSSAQCPGCLALQAQVAQLQALTVELQRQLTQQSALLDELRERDQLREQRFEELEREAHRQAAPFRRRESRRERTGKPPGRPKGHPPSNRPEPERIDETQDVPLDRCPCCNGPVDDVRPIEQIIQDLPVLRVHNLRLITYRGHCPNCGPVCSTHPAQVSNATGAAKVQLGKNLLGFIASLSKHHGLTMRRICKVLADHLGIELSPGGVSQALERIANRMAPAYEQLLKAVRETAAIHVDETGWRLDGENRWLWVFTAKFLTLYQVDKRSQDVIRRILGDDYLGVLISDCLASYDPHPGTKSKCVAHHLRAIAEALQEAPQSTFLTQIKQFWQIAILLHRLRQDLPDQEYERAVLRMEAALDEYLAQPHSLAQEVKIANRLRKQRPHLLTFLHVPGVDPTNNHAERQLRPAVISRKLSGGNKTLSGIRVFEILASLAATSEQQGRSFAELVAGWVSITGPPPAPLQFTAP